MSERKKLKMVASTTAALPVPAAPMAAPDPEVRAVGKRRRFNAAYKLSVVEEADRCSSPGAIGALLRREGLYSSHLTDWRRLRLLGTLHLNARTKPGRPKNDPLVAENERLRRDNERLAEKLRKAELVIDVQKKVQGLFESLLASEEPTKPAKKRP